MNSTPKILVVKMREILYTLLLLFLVVLLIVCLILMFSPKRKEGQATQLQTNQAQTNQTQGTQAQTSQTQGAQAQTNQTQVNQAQTTQVQTTQTQANQAQTTQAQAQATQTSASTAAVRYTPGVYTSPVTLGESAADVEITVDENRINSIRLVNLSESVSAAFPLISPTLEHLSDQILETQKLDGITCPAENKYTAQILFSAVSDAVARARCTD